MLDGQSLLDAILEAARQGASATLRDIATDARRRAPVRRVFKDSGSRKRKLRGPDVNQRNLIGRSYSLALQTARVIGSTGQYPLLTAKTGRARPNSAVPRTGKLAMLSGDRVMGSEARSFREVRRIAKGSYEFADTKIRYKVGGRVRLLDLRDEFLARASYDVSRGRGISKAGGVPQYGGTLRNSIQVVEPIRKGTGLVGFVEASAIEHGFNYAYAQEFGTSHNRPQPFLRPAARMVARHIRGNMKNAMSTYLAKIRPGHVRLTPANFKITAKLAGFKAAGPGSVVTIVNNQIDRAFAVR